MGYLGLSRLMSDLRLEYVSLAGRNIWVMLILVSPEVDLSMFVGETLAGDHRDSQERLAWQLGTLPMDSQYLL